MIKTSKGDLNVTIFEDTSRNTAINFVRLAMDGFYDKAGEGEKQKFIYSMKDAEGKPLLIQTGSPTNDFDGGPGYKIRTDKNPSRKCVRGALVMAVEHDAERGRYLPDTAGSQFFICLQDVSYYDYEPAFVVFGQVMQGLDVLDKLEEGDTIESIEVTLGSDGAPGTKIGWLSEANLDDGLNDAYGFTVRLRNSGSRPVADDPNV